jgi:UV DNA damage endonuclease
MEIGYACLTLGVQEADFRTCNQKNASEEKLLELITHNLDSLETIVDYNIKNRIRLFRITSDLIPFGSSPVNGLPWQDLFESRFARIGEKLKTANLRVSMHSGHYTVLNSPDGSVVKRAVEDLIYHEKILNALGTGTDSKIVLHVGGVYGEKEQAIRRFCENYTKLDLAIKQRLVIENDDRNYSIDEVLRIGNELEIPVVFDNLHHRVNPPKSQSAEKEAGEMETSESEWIDRAGKTWRPQDGRQKIHYSQQEPGKRTGSHSDTIHMDEFLDFYSSIKRKNVDLMLEVKDKNLSAVKCLNLISDERAIVSLEQEWARYKYLILERSPAAYEAIRALLKDKSGYPVKKFYRTLEETLKIRPEIGHAVNAAQHVWGYFKDSADEKERSRFLKLTDDYREGKTGSAQVKQHLWKMTKKYRQPYLQESLYFHI